MKPIMCCSPETHFQNYCVTYCIASSKYTVELRSRVITGCYHWCTKA